MKIIDDSYDVRTIAFSPNRTLDQKVINSIIFKYIQTWHRLIRHLSYPDIFGLTKVVNSIDVKGSIPREICSA